MSETKKGASIPTRFDSDETEFIVTLKTRARLSHSEVVRRAVRFAAPKFLSGEVDIMTLEERRQ